MRFSMISLGALMLATATPALAQDEEPASEPIKVSGGATVVSDYRFRGFTQSGENAAIQGTINLTHESGFYVGTWASSISFAGNTEVDLYAGYSKEVTPGLTLDGGLLYYLYPKHGTGATDFFEPYFNATAVAGPVTAKVGVNYAWKQAAIADFDAVYVHGDLTIAVPSAPISLLGHVGYAKSGSFLGGFDGDVYDYSFGATATWKSLTFGVSYVNTDEPNTLGWKESIGADGAVVFSVGAAF